MDNGYKPHDLWFQQLRNYNWDLIVNIFLSPSNIILELTVMTYNWGLGTK